MARCRHATLLAAAAQFDIGDRRRRGRCTWPATFASIIADDVSDGSELAMTITFPPGQFMRPGQRKVSIPTEIQPGISRIETTYNADHL